MVGERNPDLLVHIRFDNLQMNLDARLGHGAYVARAEPVVLLTSKGVRQNLVGMPHANKQIMAFHITGIVVGMESMGLSPPSITDCLLVSIDTHP